MEKLKVGIIGAGRIGQVHAKSITYHIPQAEIVAVSDIFAQGAEKLATELGMDALVETHDEHEMERALKLDAKIIGVNNRNLKDFTISLDNTVRLRPMVPKDKVFVAESGILTDADIRLLKDCEADAFLIGRALMEADDPRAVAKHWKEL